MSNPLTPLRGMDLGTISLTSPRQQRYRQTRRSTLTGEAINAIHINNELAGEDGTQIPLPNTARTLFSPTPTMNQGSTSATSQATSSGGTGSGGNTTATPLIQVPFGRVITIDDVKITLASTPADKNNFTVTRLWKKTEREQLDAEQLQTFVKAATGFVLSRTNKLAVLSTKTDDDGILKHVHNLRSQLKAIEDHLVNYDMVVFTIVSVNNLSNTGDLNTDSTGTGPIVYNLFQDYSRLHKAEVLTATPGITSGSRPTSPISRRT